MASTLKKKLLNFPTELIKRIENYQFETRKDTFTAAVMSLLDEALTKYEKEKPSEK